MVPHSGTGLVAVNLLLTGGSSGIPPDTSVLTDSTTPDTAFRWDSTNQQWIFNLGTKSFPGGNTYQLAIFLNDGTTITYMFALK